MLIASRSHISITHYAFTKCWINQAQAEATERVGEDGESLWDEKNSLKCFNTKKRLGLAKPERWT